MFSYNNISGYIVLAEPYAAVRHESQAAYEQYDGEGSYCRLRPGQGSSPACEPYLHWHGAGSAAQKMKTDEKVREEEEGCLRRLLTDE